IAERWRVQTGGDASKKLRVGDVDALMYPLIKKKTRPLITEKEADAIRTLVEEVDVEKGVVDRIKYYVRFAEKANGLEEEFLYTEDELRPIHEALNMQNVSRITFKSPRSGITYTPSDYLGIGELIRQHEIAVYRVRIARLAVLTSVEGYYEDDINQFRFYDGS